ncbi:hypothetical protein BDA96_04G088400 [Sorghum bicolor]|uniref:Uncharacterized protein n=1 Tax=Sorghum bicolor TaxID=4558 RepID=A0A921R334_SORBI|nr:hypothetical protein BDA96_04G088400 [Sorghum bicolor]
MTASRDRSRRRQRLPPSAAESIWSHSSPSAPRDRPTRADTGAAGQPPSAVKTARPARAETGAASQLPSAAKTARRTRPPSAAKIDRCSPAAVRREDCSPYASSVRREDRPPYAASRSPSTARRSRSTERPPYAAKTGLCAPIAVRRETGVRTRETGRHAPSSTAPSSSAVRVRSCPREPCPEHQGT